jgi:hypothetical protein
LLGGSWGAVQIYPVLTYPVARYPVLGRSRRTSAAIAVARYCTSIWMPSTPRSRCANVLIWLGGPW